MKRLGVIVRAILLASVVLSAGPAHAGVICNGAVVSVDQEPDGAVWANYGFGMHRICELNSAMSVNRGPSVGGVTSVTPTTCQAMLSQLMTAKASGRSIRVQVDRADCNMGNWLVPNPYPYFWSFL